MTFTPTPEQQARIEQARKDLEEARKLPGKLSTYLLDKCSSEAGISRPETDDPAMNTAPQD